MDEKPIPKTFTEWLTVEYGMPMAPEPIHERIWLAAQEAMRERAAKYVEEVGDEYTHPANVESMAGDIRALKPE